MSSASVRAGKAYVEIGARDKTQKVLKATERRLKNFGSSVTAMGAKVTAAGAAGAVALGGITTVFAGFDRQMANVAAKTGATGDTLEALRSKAKELGATTAFSASQAAEGMGFLAQAGYDADQILSGIPQVLSLAAAGGLELGEAADIASDVGSAFGLTADELGRVSDVIAATATAANTSVGMMGETFKFVAPIAKAAGQSIEETSAAAGILGNSGIKASQAGTDLKNVLVSLSNSANADAFEELGVKIKDADGEMRPMLDVMRDYGAATANMTGPERLSKATALFGKISAKSALILADSSGEVDRLRGVMNDSAGAAQRMAETMQDGVHGSLTSAGSAAEGLMIAMGEGLKPVLVSVLDTGTSLLRWATDFINRNKSVAMIIGGTVAAVTLLGVALVTLGGMATMAGMAIGGVSMAISLVAGILGTVGAPLLIIAGVLAAVTAGVVAMGSAFLYYSGVGSDAVQLLKDGFRGLLSVGKQTLGGITSALMSGNIKDAAKILWAGVRVVFFKGAHHATIAVTNMAVKMHQAMKKVAIWVANTFVGVFIKLASAVEKAKNFDFTGAMASASQMLSGISAQLGIGTDKSFAELGKEAQADLDRLTAKYQSKTQGEGNVSDELTGEMADADRKALEDAVKKFDPAAAKPADITAPAVSAGAADAIDQAAGGSGSSIGGTTSSAAAALIGFSGDNATNRIAKATEKSADALERIDENLQVSDLGAGVTIA
ncbi:phage tail tape measure protein [Crateriforma conspicua]|uniref:Phage-related minor tail protein n=1 Tax=Crateriforma conspicua TaxID=2527996 RepID=A0A5C5XSP4_9PLAN|nr:phage tail tape measure protein [Crateriforma conspicua]TWT65609.1 Phage-related minor tail protein [Crateriforma conspicua]